MPVGVLWRPPPAARLPVYRVDVIIAPGRVRPRAAPARIVIARCSTCASWPSTYPGLRQAARRLVRRTATLEVARATPMPWPGHRMATWPCCAPYADATRPPAHGLMCGAIAAAMASSSRAGALLRYGQARKGRELSVTNTWLYARHPFPWPWRAPLWAAAPARAAQGDSSSSSRVLGPQTRRWPCRATSRRSSTCGDARTGWSQPRCPTCAAHARRIYVLGVVRRRPTRVSRRGGRHILTSTSASPRHRALSQTIRACAGSQVEVQGQRERHPRPRVPTWPTPTMPIASRALRPSPNGPHSWPPAARPVM